jgi:hypothetical protein
MSISVMQSDNKVTIVIMCKDNNEAAKVAADMSADVNSGKFNPKGLSPEPEPHVEPAPKKEKAASKKKDDKEED